MPKIRTLRECPVCKMMSYRDLAILAPYVHEETASESDWITQEGEESSGLIILKSGTAEVSFSQNEEARIEIGAGDYLGELSLVDGEQRRAVGAKAVEACEFLRLHPSDYRELSTKAPPVAAKLAQGVLESVTEKMERTKELLTELGLEKSAN